jgi:hypothetical protein
MGVNFFVFCFSYFMEWLRKTSDLTSPLFRYRANMDCLSSKVNTIMQFLNILLISFCQLFALPPEVMFDLKPASGILVVSWVTRNMLSE